MSTDQQKRPAQKITKRHVDNLKPGNLIWDGAMRGFGVRCQQNAKVYILKARIKGRQRWLTIGQHGSPWTVDTAREKAQILLGQIAEGKNPAKERDTHKDQPTMKELCQRYLDDYATEHKKPSSLRTDKSNIQNHVLPLLGRDFVSDISREDIDAFKRAVRSGKTACDRKPDQQGGSSVTGGPGVANRCLALLSKMFNLAERWGWRPDNSNPVRHIDKYPEGTKERYLSEEEISCLANALKDSKADESETTYAIAALQLLIFTGARLGEILSLKWEYVDLDRALIFLPDSKTGKKSLYLSAPALNILEQLPRTEGNPYVICGSKEESPLVNLRKPWVRIRNRATLKLWSLDERLEPLFSELEKLDIPITRSRIEEIAKKQSITLNKGLTDVRIHDLRHSFASFGASGGLPLPILGKLLGHTQSVTTARYAHLADDPVRAANEAIGAKILTAMEGDQNGPLLHTPDESG